MNLAPVRCDDLDWDTVRSHDNKQTGLWCRNHRRLFFDGVCPGDAVTCGEECEECWPMHNNHYE